MRVKLFSQGADAAIQSLEDEINAFLELITARTSAMSAYPQATSRGSASVWYEEPKPIETSSRP